MLGSPSVSLSSKVKIKKHVTRARRHSIEVFVSYEARSYQYRKLFTIDTLAGDRRKSRSFVVIYSVIILPFL